MEYIWGGDLFIFDVQNITKSKKDLYPNEEMRLQNIPNVETYYNMNYVNPEK